LLLAAKAPAVTTRVKAATTVVAAIATSTASVAQSLTSTTATAAAKAVFTGSAGDVVIIVSNYTASGPDSAMDLSTKFP